MRSRSPVSVVAAARVVATYGVFCQTYDEPLHLARGMQWWCSDSYDHVHHPPLAPITYAVGPLLLSAEFRDTGDRLQDGNAVLYGEAGYVLTLGAARAGNLVFLCLAGVSTWLWGRYVGGRVAAVVAVFLLMLLPPLLAHATVATTDLAITATLPLAVYAISVWLDAPSMRTTLLCGFCLGLALLAKFSAVAFIPAAVLAIALARVGGKDELGSGVQNSILAEDRTDQRRKARRPKLNSIRLTPRAMLVACIAAWLFQQHDVGRVPFFWGDSNPVEGSWLFFPVVLAVKTPLAFLALAMLGAIVVLRASPGMRIERSLAAVGVPLAMLLAVLPSHINLGVRHVLPLFPLLAVLGAHGAVCLWNAARWRRPARVVACASVVWLAWSSAAAHPDYLAYFNELAGSHPEEIVVDSDLDWGQDLLRLCDELRRRNVRQVHLAYFGTAIPGRHGLPKIEYLLPGERAAGWIAVSLYLLKTNPGYRWLEDFDPVAMAGKSVRLYQIDPR